ncbi:hypothetical protein [Leptolyngbya sp. PL-A3]|uniref:hypothetical protein n=1 Tax=Leptolyngbya sp. PL-A3 TaxID=2933911 RepID=UPI0032998C1D
MKHSSFKMHKYVWAWVAIFAAFAASFPMAMLRVSQTEKFAGQPFKSLTCEGQSPTQQQITQFSSCAQLNLEASSAH